MPRSSKREADSSFPAAAGSTCFSSLLQVRDKHYMLPLRAREAAGGLSGATHVQISYLQPADMHAAELQLPTCSRRHITTCSWGIAPLCFCGIADFAALQILHRHTVTPASHLGLSLLQ